MVLAPRAGDNEVVGGGGGRADETVATKVGR